MTKSIRLMIGATALAFSSLSHAQTGWYVSGYVSSADIGDINTVSAPVAGVARSLELGSDREAGFSIALGRTLFSNDTGDLDLELGYQFINSDSDVIVFNGNSFDSDANRAEGDISADTISLTAIYRLNLDAFRPYVGIGIGSTDADIDVRYGGSAGAGAGQPPFVNDSDNAFSIQYRAGLEYGFTDNLLGFVEYRYIDVNDIEVVRRGGGPGGLANTNQVGDFDVENIGVGIRYAF